MTKLKPLDEAVGELKKTSDNLKSIQEVVKHLEKMSGEYSNINERLSSSLNGLDNKLAVVEKIVQKIDNIEFPKRLDNLNSSVVNAQSALQQLSSTTQVTNTEVKDLIKEIKQQQSTFLKKIIFILYFLGVIIILIYVPILFILQQTSLILK